MGSGMEHHGAVQSPDEGPRTGFMILSEINSDDRPGTEEMAREARPLLDSALDHGRETLFLEAIAMGRYEPGLLFDDHPDILSRLIDHPALHWKVRNVRDYLESSKDS